MRRVGVRHRRFGIPLAYVTAARTEGIIERCGRHTSSQQFYFDEVYQWTINTVVLTLGNAVAFVDRRIVNDVGVNGPGVATAWSGAVLRLVQTGKLYSYALGMVLGFLALAVAWWVAQ